MIRFILASLSGALLLPTLAHGEGKANQDWAEEAALKYERKSVEAAKAGNEKAAEIYQRMAAIKREAGIASKEGKEFSWDEYHKLNAELQGGHDGKHKKGDKETHHKKRADKDHKEDFIKTAKDYERKSRLAANKGDAEKARIYTEMAVIKRDAAAAAKTGEEFDWERYHELERKLHGAPKEEDKEARREKKPTRKPDEDDRPDTDVYVE